MSSNSHQFPDLPPLHGRGEEEAGTSPRRPWPPSPATVEAGGYVPGRAPDAWSASQSTTSILGVGPGGQPGATSGALSGATGSWAAVSALMPRSALSDALDTNVDDEPAPDGDTWASDADFLEACRAEYDRISGELRELRLLVKQAGKDLDKFVHRKVIAAAHVREMEERLETHSRQEIRTAYLEAAETEMRAFMMGEQRDQLRAKLRTYGEYARFLQRAVTMLQPPAFERSTLLPAGSGWPMPMPMPMPPAASPMPLPYPATPPLPLTPPMPDTAPLPVTPSTASGSWPVLPEVPPIAAVPWGAGSQFSSPRAPGGSSRRGDTPVDVPALVARVVEAQESVRRHVAQRLYEGPAQSLANVLLAAEICERLVSSDPRRAVGELGNLKGRVNATLRETRGFIDELLPPTLEELGLVATLRRYAADVAERHEVQVSTNLPPTEPGLPRDREIAFFRVAQEAILNAIEHGRARAVEVTLQVARDAVGLTVEDNGTGFDVEQTSAARDARMTGLVSMQQRADMLGGWLKVESTPGGGTRIELAAPR